MPPPSTAQLDSLFAHQGRVRALVRALLRDEHATEDVVQEAWVRTLEGGPRDPGALRGWFERVARHLALNRLRGGRRRDWRERETARDEALPSSAEIAAAAELQRRLLDTLEALPEPQRSTMRDRYIGELTPTEIARRDGLPLDTVKSRLARGRELMRERLDESSGPDGAHWSAIFLPLAVPRGAAPLTTAQIVAASSTASLIAGTLGALAMKKFALAAAVAALSMIAWKSWTTDSPERHLQESQDTEVVAQTPLEELATVDQASDVVSAPQTTPDPAPRTAAIEPEDAWTVTGKIVVGNTDPRPPAEPVEVTLTMHAGDSADGELLMRTTVTTNESGQFAWTPDDAEGVVTLTASVTQPDFLVWGLRPVVVEFGAVPTYLNIRLLPRDSTVAGTVTLPGGAPAAGARVSWGFFDTIANDSGEYEIPVAGRGLFLGTAIAEGYGQDEQMIEPVKPGTSVHCDFELQEELRISGVVRDESGRPLEGAAVQTFYGRNLGTTTDRSGRYEIRNFPRSTRDSGMVIARREGLCEVTEDFDIPSTGDIELDLVMQRGARVAGRVLDETGNPIAGVELYIGFSQNASNRIDAKTDAEGAFTFAVVPSGPQKLTARTDGYAPRELQISIPDGAANIPDIEITLGVGRTVTGVVRDANGEAQAGISLSALRGYEYLNSRTGSDEHGRFELTCIPVGPLKIEAYGGDFMRTKVKVAADHEGDVIVVLSRAGMVRGRVVDGATGAPITNFQIRFADPLLEEGDKRITGYRGTWIRQGKTFDNVEGAWSTKGQPLEPGRVMAIQATATGYAQGIVPRVVVPAAGAAEEVIVKLWKPVDILVDAVSGDTGAPLEGLQIVASQERSPGEYDEQWTATTDGNGGVKYANVPPGPLFLAVSGAGVLPRTFGPFQIEERAHNQRLELQLAGGATLVGQALDDVTGDPRGDVELRLVAVDVEGLDSVELTTTSLVDGSFAFNGLAPGLYLLSRRIAYEGGTYPDLSLNVRIEAGQDKTYVDMRAPEGSATIHGTVSSDLDLPAQLRVEFLPYEIDIARRSVLCVDGQFRLAGLPAGKYLVSASHYDASLATRVMGTAIVEVAAGGQVEASFELKPIER